jgi:glycosyltransferase involved in cell wall biosynthesis
MRVRELSVFLPCYEEEGNVARTVERAVAVLRERDLERFEVIVVNDGSRDRTGPIADTLAAEYDEVRVAHHVQNQGYGAALRTGLDEAKFPWVFFTDGDGQFDLAEIDGFLAAADDVEVVIGYRLQRADHFGRRVNTWLWSLAVRTLFRLRVRDVDCAFKLLSRHSLDEVGPLTASGAVISTELLVGIRRAGLAITQIGVHHLPRQAGSPTGASLKVILRAIRELVALRWHTWRRSRHAPRSGA